MKKHFILGVDPGSLSCGYALLRIEESSLYLIDSGNIKMKSSTPLAERIKNVYEFLESLICEYKKDSISLIVESQYLGKNVSSLMTLSCIKGAVLLLGSQKCSRVYEVSPNEAKKTFGIGNTSKEYISHMVKNLFPDFSPQTYDESDAVAIALSLLVFREQI